MIPNKTHAAWIDYIFLFFLGILLIFIILFSKSLWTTLILGLAIIGLTISVVTGRLKASRNSMLIKDLYKNEINRNLSIAPGMLGEILKEIPGARSIQKEIANIIFEKFHIMKLVIYFKGTENYEAKIYYNINPRLLNNPRIERIRHLLKDLPRNGRKVDDDKMAGLFIKEKALDDFKFASIFIYGLGRSRSVIVVSDDPDGHFSDALRDDEFNRVFWPALDELIRNYGKTRQVDMELKKLKNDFSKSKRDLLKAGKEVNKRISELDSFVDISANLYSILDENQLFTTLKNTLISRLEVSKVEILYPTGEGNYGADGRSENKSVEAGSLVLEPDSELFEMISNKPKPHLLPLAASGLKDGNGFLKSALNQGFHLISPLGIGNEVGCLLLVGQKKNKSHYDDSELNFISVISNIASLSLANIRQFATIEKLSYTDSMTGIFNYRYFYKRLGEEILRAKRYNRELSLVILDIDNFKLFNDNYGHQTGDMVLKSTSELITRAIRSIDIVSRYGGEEFCIIMPDTSENNGRVFIDRLRNEIADFRFKSQNMQKEVSITVSVGCSVFPHHATTSDRLIYCADMALLKAKSLGRNKAIMYQSDFVENETSPRGG
jgi:diguanylate cyclase (GGDEF)-like protein